ncbi:PTS system, ascorbate-specific IIA component [Spiroplasma helicoides]|uniref:Ascorbate-specific PTS system EIIA component n=1 Tax=Spiroplasma helicoides TaxID=216938 RepID=A0A1B3SM11_9MOLU|nr:PTS sugar transporter subunit IIA [Spiroplasma helicoides]AOG60968.1 PTS system, ascorbate-specific IIA component [Spiroplasma helicoides]
MVEKENFLYVPEVKDWKELLKIGTSYLKEKNIVTNKYHEALLKEIDKLGFYFIISKEIALVHIAPGGENLKTNLLFINLGKEINFSSDERHKVKHCFFLTAINSQDHIEILSNFAKEMSNKQFVKELDGVKDYENYLSISKQYFK